MNTACIVQARLTSKRLPGKVMYPLAGEPVIRHVLKRVKEIPGIDLVICAVPDDARSDVITNEADRAGVAVFRGPEFDVLDRYWRAAIKYEVDIIVRVTADCPLIDPIICGEVLALLGDADYASNVHPRTRCKGLDCEVFTFHALDTAWNHASKPYDHEHVTPWMQNNLACKVLPSKFNKNLNLCLDTAEDYFRLKGMFE